jgi:hypothetical protein
MYDPASQPGGAPDSGLGWRLFGVLLVIAGVLITIFAGLCTTAVVMDPGGGPELGDMTGAALVIGGPTILVGVLLWWGGMRAFRKGQRARAAQLAQAPAPDTRPPEPPTTA